MTSNPLRTITTPHGLFYVRPDSSDEFVLSERQYSRLFREDLVRSTDRWLDVGANIGSFTVRISPLVEAVVAVEPDPDNVRVLRTNLDLNSLANVTVVEAAATTSSDATVVLALAKSQMSHRVGRVRGREHVDVAAVSVDALIDEFKIDCLKLDCEGSEADILERTDLSSIKTIAYEWHFTTIPDPDWSHYRSVLERLSSLEFNLLLAPTHWSKRRHASVLATRKEVAPDPTPSL